MKPFMLPISALILGVSLIIAALIVKETFQTQTVSEAQVKAQIQQAETQSLSIPDPNLMTKKQLSGYLQVSEKEITQILADDAYQKAKLGGSYDLYEFLPYVKLGDQVFFMRTEIEKWLEYKTEHQVGQSPY